MSKPKIQDIAYYNRKTVLNNLKKGSDSLKIQTASELKKYIKAYICPVIEAIVAVPEDSDGSSIKVLEAMKAGTLNDIYKDILSSIYSANIADPYMNMGPTDAIPATATARITEPAQPLIVTEAGDTDTDINTIL